MAVFRHQIADYITADSTSTEFLFLGAGVSTLDEEPAAVTEEDASIPDKAKSTDTIGYAYTFPFESKLLLEAGAEDGAIKSIHDAPYLAQVGEECRRDYVRVELFKPVAEKENTFKARKFRVAVAVSGVTGPATEKMKMAGNLNAIGDPEWGEFDTTTKTFTEVPNV